MYEKEKDLIAAWQRGQMSRRSLIRGLGALGMTAAGAGTLVNMMQNLSESMMKWPRVYHIHQWQLFRMLGILYIWRIQEIS